MSKLRLQPELFLGKQELTLFQEFLDEDSFRELLRRNSGSVGIIDSVSDLSFENFKVTPSTTVGTFKIHPSSRAIDSDGNLITYEQTYTEEISVPLPNEWYYVRIKHKYDATEKGIVSIDVQGNLTGIGTEFTKTLRGLPNFPTKIKFKNASLNTGEYVVVQVIDDLNAVIQGSLQNESQIKYSVWGTFTPGHIATLGVDAEPLQYDSVEITLVRESTATIDPDTGEPTKVAGLEFHIARVRLDGTIVTVQDRRNEFWRDRADFKNSNTPTTNALIGVESVKWNNTLTPLYENQISIGWAFRSSNWTIDPTLRLMTINAGEGGIFKSTADFSNGQFNGWRLYNKDGRYFIIESSIKSGSQINLTVRGLEPSKFTVSDEVLITPDSEQIEIELSPTANDEVNEQLRVKEIFSINSRFGKIFATVPVKTGTYSYYAKYRFKNNQNYSQWFDFPSDVTNGYYDETSFESNGELKVNPVDRNRKTYTVAPNVGFIELIPNINHYANVLDRVDIGDLLGVEYRSLDNLNPTIDVEVGVNRQVQVIQAASIVLGTDHFINLSTTGAVNGNRFYLFFEDVIDLNGYNVFITQDFVNPGSPGTIKVTIEDWLANQSDLKNLMLRCDFDGADWHVFTHVSEKKDEWHYVGESSGLGVVFIDSWANTGSGNRLRFKMDYVNKQLHIAGSVSRNGSATSSVATLPVAYRPNDNRQTTIYAFDSTAGVTHPALFQLTAAGTIGILGFSGLATVRPVDICNFSLIFDLWD